MKQSQQNLFVFDADGVLLNNTLGGFKEILINYFGKEKEVQAIHKKYERRKHLGPWGLEQLAELYQGLNFKEVSRAAADYIKNFLMPGAAETLNFFKQKNYLTAALSSNPIFIMEALKNLLELDLVAGNILEIKDGKYTGIILQKVDRFTKKEKLQKIINEHQPTDKIVVIGDSITDLPMAELATHFIAFNTNKSDVLAKANYIIKEKNLAKICELSF